MKKIYFALSLLATLTATNHVTSAHAEGKSDAPSIEAAQAKKPDMSDKANGSADKGDLEAYKDVKVIDENRITSIGKIETIKAKFEDTLLELGREHNLGYVEIVAANPGVDPWLPGEDTEIILPKQHLLPSAPQQGIVINVAEMRLYDYTDGDIKTYPIGIGRDGLSTPLGETTIVRKMEGPTWRPTPRMRKEKPELPAVVPPGEDNPLGTHALYLGWPQYLIHGTHKPLGVGRRVSSGCIRMYPEDIITVFSEIPVGTKVTVVKEPIKFAWIDDMLYMEAHAEDELADSYESIGTIKEYRVPETLFTDVTKVAGDEKDRLDWAKIREAVKSRNGLPIAILTKSAEGIVEVDESILEEVSDIQEISDIDVAVNEDIESEIEKKDREEIRWNTN